MAPSIEQAFGRAFTSFRAGNLNEAERSFKEVLRQDPRHVAALNLLGIVLTHMKKYQEAESYLRSALKLNPSSDATLYNYGIILKALNRPQEALERFSQALAINSTNAATWNNRGTVLNEMKKYDEAIRDFDKSILLDANYSDAYCNKGKSLNELRRYQEALAAYERAIALKPDLAEAWLGRGNVLGEIKSLDEAFQSCDKALALKPQLAEAWLSRANILFNLERYDEALASYDKALALAPRLAVAWVGRGNTLFELARHHEALRAYEGAIALDPELGAAFVGYGNALCCFQRYEEALAAYDKTLALEPDLGEAWLGVGNVLFGLKHHDGAASAYDKALGLKPTLAAAWLGRGNILFSLKQYEDAVAAYDRALALKPGLTGVEGLRLHAKGQLCDWSDFDAECAHLISALRTGTPNTGPFQLLPLPSTPKDQLQCAKLWAGKHFTPATSPLWRGERYDHERLRVAYLSADFRQHPVAMCMAGVIACHDKSLFEVTALSCGPDDNSEIRRRLQTSFERFIDAQTYSDEQIAKLVKELEIDILVDLMGYTVDSRTGVFARRPAPTQVNYFGYSGTMGVDYIDYLIGDRTIIPQNARQFYSENIVYLPHSFLPPDNKRSISNKNFSRTEAGLPENEFVFCSFNNHYKITPEVFGSWMRILSEVQGSVLWLIETNSTAESNLRKEAVARGINPDRLVFAGRMPPADHLARHQLADLFLDTLPYNAHTTASEALWTGLPILTRIGETFAGRVAASLLNAIKMPELVTTTAQAYEQMAIDLAANPEQMTALKRKLVENRHSAPLFDTASFTKAMEKAYLTMHRRHLNGLRSDDIVVSD